MIPAWARDGGIRASDETRERTARALAEHFASGRLTVEELDDRLTRAYRASTVEEARSLLSDLPSPRPGRLASVADGVQRALLWGHAAAWGGTSAAGVAVWGLAGGGEFWPAWIILPWGALVAWHAAGSRRLSRALGARAAAGRERMLPQPRSLQR